MRKRFALSTLLGFVVASGGYAVNASTDGVPAPSNLWAWGNNYFGQLGDGTTSSSLIPVKVDGLTGAVAVAAGENHSLAIESLLVSIDITPSNSNNIVNPGSRGVIPVALLGSETFDVMLVNTETLRFGPAGAAVVSTPRYRDVNRDGFLDLVAHFDVGASGITGGMTSATLAGKLSSGEAFMGADSIMTVPGQDKTGPQ